MSKAWKFSLAGIVAAMMVAGQSSVEARPQYLGAFTKNYTDLAAEANKAKCAICHGKDKKERNNYGAALGKAIGKKNEKDADALKAALKKAEAGKSDVEGKTFGDLIKDGKLPNAK